MKKNIPNDKESVQLTTCKFHAKEQFNSSGNSKNRKSGWTAFYWFQERALSQGKREIRKKKIGGQESWRWRKFAGWHVCKSVFVVLARRMCYIL